MPERIVTPTPVAAHRTVSGMAQTAPRSADTPSRGTGLHNVVRKTPAAPGRYFCRSFISVTMVIEIGPVEKPPTLKAWWSISVVAVKATHSPL